MLRFIGLGLNRLGTCEEHAADESVAESHRVTPSHTRGFQDALNLDAAAKAALAPRLGTDSRNSISGFRSGGRGAWGGRFFAACWFPFWKASLPRVAVVRGGARRMPLVQNTTLHIASPKH